MLPIDLQILKYYFFEKPVYHYKIKPYLSTAAYHQLSSQLESHTPDSQLETRRLQDTTFTVFDLETTGLIPEVGHEILSIGAIQIKGFDYCNKEKFYQIIKPIRPIPKHVTKLTGLDADEIRHGSNFIEAFTAFFEYSKDTVLVAHPAKFDLRFLQTLLKRWKLPAYHPYVIDSQEVAKWLLPTANCRLDPLIRYYNLDYLDRHHALNDAIMTAELFEHLLKNISEKKIETYQDLQKTLIRQKNKP